MNIPTKLGANWPNGFGKD